MDLLSCINVVSQINAVISIYINVEHIKLYYTQ